MKIGDKVFDDLTSKECTIIDLSVDEDGNIGYKLDNDVYNGWRFPWELTEIK